MAKPNSITMHKKCKVSPVQATQTCNGNRVISALDWDQ